MFSLSLTIKKSLSQLLEFMYKDKYRIPVGLRKPDLRSHDNATSQQQQRGPGYVPRQVRIH